jgi:hypothetical protein
MVNNLKIHRKRKINKYIYMISLFIAEYKLKLKKKKKKGCVNLKQTHQSLGSICWEKKRPAQRDEKATHACKCCGKIAWDRNGPTSINDIHI